MSLALRSTGSGPALVLLHGWGLSGEIFAPLVDRLAERLTCHVVDLPGHGDSPAATPEGLTGWADAVAARIDTPAVWLGWSLGGLVAMSTALRDPEAVRGLVLTATSPCLKQSDDWSYGLAPATIEATRAGLAKDYLATIKGFVKAHIGARGLDPDRLNTLIADLSARPPSAQGLAGGLDIIQQADLRARLGEIDTPACLIGGRLDRLAHPDAMRWAADAMPNAELMIHQHAAHAPFLSDTDAFVEQVVDFVTRCQPET